MFFETRDQALIFLALLYAGAVSAVLYDLLGLVRRRAGKLMTALLDVFFFVSMAVLCAPLLAASGQDGLRMYALLGVVCGALLYSLGLRALARAAFRYWTGKNRAPRRKRAPRDEL